MKTRSNYCRFGLGSGGHLNLAHRRMGSFQPFGMTKPVQLYQIFTGNVPDSQQLATYQQALGVV